MVAFLLPPVTASHSSPTSFVLRPRSPRQLPAPAEHDSDGRAGEFSQITARIRGGSISKRLNRKG